MLREWMIDDSTAEGVYVPNEITGKSFNLDKFKNQ